MYTAHVVALVGHWPTVEKEDNAATVSLSLLMPAGIKGNHAAKKDRRMECSSSPAPPTRTGLEHFRSGVQDPLRAQSSPKVLTTSQSKNSIIGRRWDKMDGEKAAAA